MRSHVVSVLVLLIIVGLFFHSLFIPSLKIFSFPDYGQSDLWQQTYPAKFFLAESLKNGELPLWNPYVGNGYPEFAKAEIGALFIPNMLFLYILPFPIAINFLYITTFLIGSLSMYFLAIRFRLQPRASLLAAVIFAYSTFFLTKLPHLSRIESVSLLPLIILTLDSLLSHPTIKKSCIFAIIAAQQIYAGHFQMIFVSWLLIVMYTGYKTYLSSIYKPLVYLGLSGLLIGMISSIQLLPSLEFIQSTARGSGFSPQQSLLYSFPWKNLATLVDPFIFGSPHDGSFAFKNFSDGNIFWENSLFISLPALILSAIALVNLKKSKDPLVLFSVILFFTAVFLMTGKYSPLYFIHSLKPFSFFRAPSKYSILAIFSLSILSAYGMNYLLGFLSKRKLPQLVIEGIFITIFFISVFQLYNFHRTYSIADSPDNLLQEPSDSRDFSNPHYRYVSYGSASPWNKMLVKDGWKDMSGFNYVQNALVPNMNVLYGYRSFDSYRILISKRSQTALSLSDNLYGLSFKNVMYQEAFNNFLDMQSVSMIVGVDLPGWIDTEVTEPAPATYTKNNLPEISRAHRSTAAPRFHFAPNLYFSETVHDISKALEDPEFEASTSAFVEERFNQPSDEEIPSLHILRDLPTHSEIATDVQSPLLFVATDTFYTGWKAFVDEKEVPIHPVNINQRGIHIPAGTQKIEMKYLPGSFALGKKIALFGYAFIGLLILYSVYREVSAISLAKR